MFVLRRREPAHRHGQRPDASRSERRRQSLSVDQEPSVRTIARARIAEHLVDDQRQTKQNSSLLSVVSQEQDRQK
jgi:hypothetical protein